MRFFTGLVVAVGCGLFSWAVARVPTKWLAVVAAPFLILDVAGYAFRPFFISISDYVVAALALLAGVVLGRVMPPRFRPFLILLLILSAIDVAQSIVWFPWFDNPIWLQIHLGLAPGDQFNIGLGVALLITATSENLRRRHVTLALSVLPGVIGTGLSAGLLATVPTGSPNFIVVIAASHVLLLAAGYVLTELAASQQLSAKA